MALTAFWSSSELSVIIAVCSLYLKSQKFPYFDRGRCYRCNPGLLSSLLQNSVAAKFLKGLAVGDFSAFRRSSSQSCSAFRSYRDLIAYVPEAWDSGVLMTLMPCSVLPWLAAILSTKSQGKQIFVDKRACPRQNLLLYRDFGLIRMDMKVWERLALILCHYHDLLEVLGQRSCLFQWQ